jgi:hypothetical protein
LLEFYIKKRTRQQIRKSAIMIYTGLYFDICIDIQTLSYFLKRKDYLKRMKSKGKWEVNLDADEGHQTSLNR